MVPVQEKTALVPTVDNKHELVLVLTLGVFGGGERVVRAVLLNGRDSDHGGVYVLVGRRLGL